MRILEILGIAGKINRLPVDPSSVDTNLLPKLPGSIHFELHGDYIDPELEIGTVSSRKTKLLQTIKDLKNVQFTEQELIAAGSNHVRAQNTIAALISGLDRLNRGR